MLRAQLPLARRLVDSEARLRAASSLHRLSSFGWSQHGINKSQLRVYYVQSSR